MQFQLFDLDRDVYRQDMRISGIAGFAFISIVFFCIGITVVPKTPEAYQQSFMLFFLTSFFAAVMCLLTLSFLWVINLNNHHPIAGDQIKELCFYARQDSDIAFFLEDIREKENRLPVLDEYFQVLSFAHERRLPIYYLQINRQDQVNI